MPVEVDPVAYAATALARAQCAEAEAAALRLELDAARAEIALLRPTQPMPSGGTGDVGQELLDLIPADHPMREAVARRREVGIARYGQPLRRGDGRAHLLDLQEELIDAAKYALSVWPEGTMARLLVEIAAEPGALVTWRDIAQMAVATQNENMALRRSLTEAARDAAEVPALRERINVLEDQQRRETRAHADAMTLHDLLDALDCGLPRLAPLPLRVAWQLGAAREAL